MAAKVKAYVPRTFNDAGTGETFKGGREHPFDAGALANYRAAGLIGVAPPRKAAPNPQKAAAPKEPRNASAPAAPAPPAARDVQDGFGN